MSQGRAKEVRAIRRHLRDLLLHRASLLDILAHIERGERPAKPSASRPATALRARSPKPKASH